MPAPKIMSKIGIREIQSGLRPVESLDKCEYINYMTFKQIPYPKVMGALSSAGYFQVSGNNTWVKTMQAEL